MKLFELRFHFCLPLGVHFFWANVALQCTTLQKIKQEPTYNMPAESPHEYDNPILSYSWGFVNYFDLKSVGHFHVPQAAFIIAVYAQNPSGTSENVLLELNVSLRPSIRESIVTASARVTLALGLNVPSG